MMFGKFIDSSTVTGTQIRLDNEQWLRSRNFANSGDLNILRINSLNQIEFKQIPYVEGQGRLALYSELDGILTSVEYLYGQLTEVTGDIVDIQAEIDALQEEVGDFAFKDLSNLTATAIPSGINLESVSIDQSAFTSFALRTKNQTTSVSGRIIIRTGTSDSAFSSGGISIDSGAVTNAIGAAATTVMTGAVALVSGTISSGTRGSTGTAFLRSGGIANISSATTYSGNSGTVGVSSGTIQSSFNGATVSGNSGFASLQTGSIIATISGATANGTSGSISVSTGGINTFAAGAIVNGNSGPLSFTSGGVTGFGTSNSNTGIVSVFSGNVTNANNTGNTGNVSIFSGSNSGTGSSGSVSISSGQSSISGNTGNIFINSGVAVSGNTGDVNISTGIPASGTQGDIRLTSPFVKLLNYTRLVLEDNLGDRVVRLQLGSPSAEGYGQFFFNRIRSDKEVFIGAMESHVDDNGADVLFSGTFSLSDNDGQYRTSNVFLQTNAESGFRDAPNVAVDTGDVTIKTGNAFVQGSYTDASSGNINITTGINQGSGSRGIVSIDGDYISVSSKQIKYLADGTDPSDAVTVSQLGSIGGSFALTDLSNLVAPTAIPDGVGLTSLTVPTIPNPLAAFEIKTSDQVGADGTGGVKLYSGNIFSPVSTQNTGIASLSTGLTLGSGNTGDVNISSGDNVGSGNSGSVNISTGASVVGTRGNINLTSNEVNVYIPNTGRFGIENTSGDALIEFDFADYGQPNDSVGMRIWNSSPINGFHIIGLGQNNQNGGPFNFESTFVVANNDGIYSGGDFNIKATSSESFFSSASNISVNSGNVNISTNNGYIAGSNTDANSGNINLTTGNAQGAGTRGYISLDGNYVTASSTQIKDVADPTDPQDALTLNYFNNNIPSVAALDFYPLQAYNTYATIYADDSAGVLDPVTPTNPRPGWYFKNSAGSPQKINWYFFDGAVVSCQLQNFAAFAVVTLDSIASLPYFIYYTFPTGSGDVIPGFAHSQVVYSAPYVPSAVVGTKYLIYFGAEPDVFPYLPRIELTYNAAASGGDQGATELVSTAAFSTDSGASANNVQVMVENLGLNISTFKAYFNLLIFPVFEESQDYYGSFYSTQDQDNLVPDIARAMTFNNTDEANGVSIVSTSQITFTSGGLYNVQFSAQFTHSNSSSQDVDIWLSKNGTNVPYTNSRETLAGQVSVISAWNFFVRVNAGDYVELYWSSPSDDVVIQYTAAQTVPTRPETPSIILTVNKIIS